MMYTPNGRFQTNKRICTSFSDFHPESWDSTWSVGTLLTGLLSFMTDDTETTHIGGLNEGEVRKKQYAAASLKFNQQNPKFNELFEDLLDEIEEKKNLERKKLEQQREKENLEREKLKKAESEKKKKILQDQKERLAREQREQERVRKAEIERLKAEKAIEERERMRVVLAKEVELSKKKKKDTENKLPASTSRNRPENEIGQTQVLCMNCKSMICKLSDLKVELHKKNAVKLRLDVLKNNLSCKVVSHSRIICKVLIDSNTGKLCQSPLGLRKKEDDKNQANLNTQFLSFKNLKTNEIQPMKNWAACEEIHEYFINSRKKGANVNIENSSQVATRPKVSPKTVNTTTIQTQTENNNMSKWVQTNRSFSKSKGTQTLPISAEKIQDEMNDLLETTFQCVVCYTFQPNLGQTNCCFQYLCQECHSKIKAEARHEYDRWGGHYGAINGKCPYCKKSGFTINIINKMGTKLEEFKTDLLATIDTGLQNYVVGNGNLLKFSTQDERTILILNLPPLPARFGNIRQAYQKIPKYREQLSLKFPAAKNIRIPFKNIGVPDKAFLDFNTNEDCEAALNMQKVTIFNKELPIIRARNNQETVLLKYRKENAEMKQKIKDLETNLNETLNQNQISQIQHEDEIQNLNLHIIEQDSKIKDLKRLLEDRDIQVSKLTIDQKDSKSKINQLETALANEKTEKLKSKQGYEMVIKRVILKNDDLEAENQTLKRYQDVNEYLSDINSKNSVIKARDLKIKELNSKEEELRSDLIEEKRLRCLDINDKHNLSDENSRLKRELAVYHEKERRYKEKGCSIM